MDLRSSASGAPTSEDSAGTAHGAVKLGDLVRSAIADVQQLVYLELKIVESDILAHGRRLILAVGMCVASLLTLTISAIFLSSSLVGFLSSSMMSRLHAELYVGLGWLLLSAILMISLYRRFKSSGNAD